MALSLFLMPAGSTSNLIMGYLDTYPLKLNKIKESSWYTEIFSFPWHENIIHGRCLNTVNNALPSLQCTKDAIAIPLGIKVISKMAAGLHRYVINVSISESHLDNMMI